MAQNWHDPEKHADYERRIHHERYYLARHFVEGTVLDLGCGYGAGTLLLADHCTGITAYDWDDVAIKTAKNNNHCSDRVVYYEADLRTIDPPAADWTLSLEVIEHLVERDAYVQMLQAKARKGVVLSTPLVGVVKPEKGQYYIYTPEELRALFPEDEWQLVFESRIREFKAKAILDMYFFGVWHRIGYQPVQQEAEERQGHPPVATRPVYYRDRLKK